MAKITEKLLLDNYDGITHGGSKVSLINGQKVWWVYRVEHDEGVAVCSANRADFISLENDRTGRIELDQSHKNHPAIERINSDEEKLWGDEI